MDKFYTTEVATQGYYKPQEYTDSELRGKGGIYQIRNVVNGKVYVGSSVNLVKRRHTHFNELRKGIHTNGYLQRAFNKYGETNFVFEIIEFTTDRTNILKLEQYWIDKLKVVKRGYNISPIADKPPTMVGAENPMYGRNHTEESKKLMSLHKIGTQAYGDNPRAIPIICLTDGKKFDCIQRCVEYYHRDRSSICKNLEYTYLDPQLRFMFLDKYDELISQGLSHEDIIQFHRNSYKKPCKS